MLINKINKLKNTYKAEQGTKKILDNAFWMIFDKVFILFLNLAVTVQVANHFGKSEYGSYEYAISVIAILEILVTFVDGRVVKKYYKDNNAEKLVFNATICRAFFSGISALIGIFFILWKDRGDTFSAIFAILLLNAIVTNLRFGMVNRFEYLLKSRKVVIAADISAFIGGVLQLIAVQMDWSLVAISIIAATTSAINLAIVFVQYRAEFCNVEKGSFDKNVVVRMIRESLPLAIASSCATVYTRCDSVMLGNMLSDGEVGVYAIAVKLVSVVQIVAVAVRESVYPQLITLYSVSKKRYAQQYIQITSMLTWLYIAGIGISFLILPQVFRFLNPDYADAFSVYKVLVISAFFMYNAALRAGHYTLINRGDILMYVQMLCVVLNIGLNWIGIRLWGMYGAALATVVTQGISLFFSNIFFGAEGREVLAWQIKSLNPVNVVRQNHV